MLFSFYVCLSMCLCAMDQSVRSVDNVIEMPNSTDFRFGVHVPRDRTRPRKNFLKRGLLPGSHDSINFGALMLIASKLFMLWTSNLTCMFPGTVGQWLATNCAALPTASAVQYATSHCKPLLF